MKKNKFVTTICSLTVLLAIAFTLSNCESNSEKQTQDTSFSIAMAKDWYHYKFKESAEWKENNERENMIPDWNHPIFRKLDGLEVVEFPLIQKDLKINTTSKELNTSLLKIGFMKINNDSIIARKLYYIPELNYLNKSPYNETKINLSKYNNDFIGLLITKKWNNETLSYKKISKNTINELAIPDDLRKSNKNSKLTSGVPTTENPSWFIELNSVTIMGGQRRYYYYINPFSTKTDLYKESYFNNNTYQYNGYYYPLTSGSRVALAVTTAQSIENTTIYSTFSNCKKAILERLKNSTDIDIANLFTALGADTKIKVTLIDDYPVNDKGIPIWTVASTTRTNPKTPFDYTIRINPDYTHNNLSLAVTMLHELVHAYFMSLTDNMSKDNGLVSNNYPLLFQAYCDKFYPGRADIHHEEMANKYVIAMARALQEFQTGVPAVNGVPDKLYLDLAWGGLHDTPIYEKNFPLGSAERNRIDSEFQAELRNGYVGGYYPIGAKCN
ncbi:hypothetical protein SAMN05444671_3212 [Flavobacterium sp. CF108]|uniref:hypothetical protein n=1 Tax=unclassified Flavobacterium TaxID=196869 RepID=UPI0008D52792|nr:MULTISPECIES: hypothetical protein [unclassified Flavobacterium]SEP28122.1 hypothetical protein SAMN04487978_0344 [Flavobacterium sp. fv08]SHH57375.1 hypothetical protein SAMN05444671_3212 [Flavobacterium sp. CF108]